MGLDIYAGTLVRYYTRNWKTANQKFCEANGFEYRQIRTDNAPRPSVESVMPAVNNWVKKVIQVLHNSGVESAEAWEENNEKPYYTEKPDWDAFNALLLYAASKILGKDFPKEFHKNTDIYGHSLMKEMDETKNTRGRSLFGDICYWLPINETIMFSFPMPTGADANIAATGLLKSELSRINELGWNADRETILSWISTEGYPADASVDKNGLMQQLNVNEIYNTESLAKFAFSILWEAVEFSENERVPIILDF